MLIGAVWGQQVQVRLNGSGRFWCLNCEAPREYQHREWRSQGMLMFSPTGRVSGGEFIVCRDCELTFSLAVLGESSTATFDELLVDAPDFAVTAPVRPGPRRSRDLSPAPGASVAAAAHASVVPVAPSARPQLQEPQDGGKPGIGLSAHSARRRHQGAFEK